MINADISRHIQSRGSSSRCCQRQSEAIIETGLQQHVRTVILVGGGRGAKGIVVVAGPELNTVEDGSHLTQPHRVEVV